MKKLLLTLVACFAVLTAMAQSNWTTSGYVNICGGFNNWGDNGLQPNSDGITIHKNLPVGTTEFKIKTYFGGDAWWGTGGAIQVGVPTKVTSNTGNMTISGATSGETFNVQWNCKTQEILITRPGEDQVIEWYVCGDFQGTNWNPGDANYKFTKQSDGSYKSPTISKLTNFLITQGDWASKYGGNGSDVTVGTPYTLVLNGQDLTMGDGKYVQNAVITIDNENKMTVSGNLIDEGAKYYLVGDAFGGWSTPNNYELIQTVAGSGTYSITASFAAGAGFKICSGSNYYTYSEAPIPAEGGTFTVYTGGTDNDTKFAATMTDATIDFNPAEMTLTVTPSGIVSAPTLYIVGNNINGNEEWVVGDDNEMTYDESSKTYTWEGSILGSGFKINNGAWDVYNIGAPSADGSNVVLTLNQPFTIENNGGSKDIELGRYPSIVNPVVTLSLENSTLTITGQYGYPESMYILGNVDGSEFVPESAIEMTASSGVYTIEANVTASGDGSGYIQFATQKAPEGSDSPWDNMGIRLGSETDNLEVVLDASSHSATYELYANGSGTTSFKVTPGVYDVEVDYTGAAPQVTFSQKPSAPAYIQIAFNTSANSLMATWATYVVMNPDTDTKLEMIEDGVYQVKNIEMPLQKAFYFYTGSGDDLTKYTSTGETAFASKDITFPNNATNWPNTDTEEGANTVTINQVGAWYIGSSPGATVSGTWKFDVTVNLNDMTLQLVDANASEPEPELPTTLYLMGWGEGDSVTVREAMSVSSTDDHVFEYTYNVPNTAEGFKFYFSTTGSVEANNNYIPVANNTTISFDSDKKYTATWSDNGAGQAIDRVAGETVFRFNVETLECEVEYAGNFVNFEFTGVENAYYYVNMANLTGDDMVVYLNSNSVQYGIDKSGLTQLVASPKDGYTLEITCPEAQSTSTYMITPGGQGDEQVISLYSGAQGYTFTFTVSEKVEAEPVYVLSGPIFLGKTETMEMTLDGTTATALAVCWPQIFTIQKKVDDKVVETYGGGVGITSFGEYQGSEGGSNWTLSDLVVNGTGSPIAFSFDTETLVLTVSTGITADAGSDETEQSGSVTDNKTINIVSENPAVLVFLNVPEEAKPVYYKVNYNQPAGKNAHRVAPDGYEQAEKYEGKGDDNGRYAVSLLTGTSGTLDVIYELDGAQSKPQTYNFTVTKDVPTGVDGIAADEEGAEYYTLDGVKVKNPEKGIYIRVKNGEVTKVVK